MCTTPFGSAVTKGAPAAEVPSARCFYRASFAGPWAAPSGQFSSLWGAAGFLQRFGIVRLQKPTEGASLVLGGQMQI